MSFEVSTNVAMYFWVGVVIGILGTVTFIKARKEFHERSNKS